MVWGDEQYSSLYNSALHDKQDIIARVCARLQPPQRNSEEIDSYEVSKLVDDLNLWISADFIISLNGNSDGF